MKNKILESSPNKLAKLIENEINYYLNILKKLYETDTLEDWASNSAIVISDLINSIKVTNIERNEDHIIIRVEINLDSIMIPPNIDDVFDSILGELQPHFGRIYYVVDEINKPNRNW